MAEEVEARTAGRLPRDPSGAGADADAIGPPVVVREEPTGLSLGHRLGDPPVIHGARPLTAPPAWMPVINGSFQHKS